MRILHINTNYLGTKLHQTMIEHFDDDIKNEVFVPTYSKDNSVIIPNKNVKVCECFRKWDRVLFCYKQKKILNTLKDSYEFDRFELVHAHTLFTDGNCARELSKEYGIPYMVAVRNTDVNTFFKKAFWLRNLGIRILRDASAIIFLSPAYKQEVLSKYVPNTITPIPEKKIYVIPNGIDDYWLKHIYSDKDIHSVAKRIKSKELRLIYAGEISKNKNIDLTVKAIHALREYGYHVKYSIVGKIKDESIYNRIIKEPFVHYVEPQAKEGLLECYRENDIFVMPSHTETFGLVYAEAMSQGLPVIYTRGQGFDQQFDEGKVGFSTSDRDSQELVMRIIEIIENYEECVRNSLRLCRNFDWGNIVAIYSRIYRDLIINNGSIIER